MQYATGISQQKDRCLVRPCNVVLSPGMQAEVDQSSQLCRCTRERHNLMRLRQFCLQLLHATHAPHSRADTSRGLHLRENGRPDIMSMAAMASILALSNTAKSFVECTAFSTAACRLSASMSMRLNAQQHACISAMASLVDSFSALSIGSLHGMN